MENLKINHAAVWVIVILLHVLGFVWYGPLLGEKWMSLVGLDAAVVEANPPGLGIWITNLVATVVPTYTMAWLFTKLNIESAGQGAMTGLVIAFSFNFLSRMTSNLFAQAPYELSWITGGFDLVAMTLAGLILGVWRKYG